MTLCGYTRKHIIGLLNGRGRPCLPKRSRSKPIYPTKQLRMALSGFGLGAISFAADGFKHGCQAGCRIRRKNMTHSLCRLKEIGKASVGRQLIDFVLRREVKRGQKGRGPILVDLEKPDPAGNRSVRRASARVYGGRNRGAMWKQSKTSAMHAFAIVPRARHDRPWYAVMM